MIRIKTIYVRDLSGNEYACQATITNDYELNGNQALSAVLLPSKVNRAFIDDIAEMWQITDFDDVEHRIVYVKKRGEGGSLTVEIKAVPTFFDDFDTDRIYEEYNEHMTAQRCFSLIFDGSPYNVVLNGSFDAVEWQGLGGGETRLEMFKRALERYKAEFRIVGNTVYIENLIGRDTQFQYRYRLNASNITKEHDAKELWTYAKGYADYEDDEEGGWENAKLIREYTSPLAKIIGIRHAPPIKDGRIKHANVLNGQLKTLVDESLKISIEADIHDLRRQGYPLAQPVMGDRVFVIDERIGLDEEVRVVAMSVTRNWRGEVIECTLTFGSEGVTKRYQSNLSTAVKDITEVMSGRKKLPYSVLDNAVLQATQALQNAQTELKFTSNGILAIDKNDPNLVTLFNSAGLGVSRDGGATFENAITGHGINASVITTGSMLADRIAGGVLSSLNDNVEFDLNNSVFKVRSGGQFIFEDSGNGIKYVRNNHSAGMIMATSLNYNLPMTAIGVDSGNGVINANSPDFTGIRIHSREASHNNSLVGGVWQFTTRPDYSTASIIVKTDGSTGGRGIFPQRAGTYDYDLGTGANYWNDFYIKGDIKNQGVTTIHDNTSVGGWRMETRADSGSTTITLRGINTNQRNYNLGASGYRINRIYLSNSPDVSSDERLKTDISNNVLGLDFIDDVNTVNYRLNKLSCDVGNLKQNGVIAQQLLPVLVKHGVDVNDTMLVRMNDDGYYSVAYEQFIPIIIKAIQELSNKIEVIEREGA